MPWWRWVEPLHRRIAYAWAWAVWWWQVLLTAHTIPRVALHARLCGRPDHVARVALAVLVWSAYDALGSILERDDHED
jgi:hypothetical protein